MSLLCCDVKSVVCDSCQSWCCLKPDWEVPWTSCGLIENRLCCSRDGSGNLSFRSVFIDHLWWNQTDDSAQTERRYLCCCWRRQDYNINFLLILIAWKIHFYSPRVQKMWGWIKFISQPAAGLLKGKGRDEPVEADAGNDSSVRCLFSKLSKPQKKKLGVYYSWVSSYVTQKKTKPLTAQGGSLSMSQVFIVCPLEKMRFWLWLLSCFMRRIKDIMSNLSLA